MRRVKLFQGVDVSQLGAEINAWLTHNPMCKLGRTQLATSVDPSQTPVGDAALATTVLISYEEQP